MTREELQIELIENIKALGGAVHVKPSDLLFAKDAAGMMTDEEYAASIVIARELVEEARGAALRIMCK